MQQWALDMEDNPAQAQQESAEASADILREAAALDEQGTDAEDETAASQQGSQDIADSFQETGWSTDSVSTLHMCMSC